MLSGGYEERDAARRRELEARNRREIALVRRIKTLEAAIQKHLDTFGYDNHEGLADALAGDGDD